MSNTKAELQFENRRLKHRVRALERAANHKVGLKDSAQSLFGALPVILWTADLDLRFTSFEGSAVGFRDFHPGGVIGLTFYEFFQTVDPTSPAIAAAMRALSGETIQYAGEWREKYFLAYVTPAIDPNGEIVGLRGVSLDLTEQREFESRLRDVENRYRGLLSGIDELVFWYEFDGTIVFANAAAEKLLGYSGAGLRGRNIADLLDGPSALIVNGHTHLLSGGGLPADLDVVFLSECGRRINLQLLSQLVLSHGQPFCIQTTGRDMTVRKALERQMRSSQKMHAVGLLTGSVAHHLDTILTRVAASAGTCFTESKSKEAEDILTASEEAASLVRSLRLLSQSTKSEVDRVDVHGAIGEVVAVLQKTCDKRIRIVASLRATESHVQADGQQIHQAILSLCLNACDAMPDGGELRVYTRNTGSKMVVSIKDTGVGIPERNRRRIFEPFFTTKEQSSGLGLALVEGIVRLHNGSIHLDSAEKEGTVFHLTLPSCVPATLPAVSAQFAGTSNGRVLVINDDIAACQVVGKALRTLGYDVELCALQHGLEYYEQNYFHIDLVFLDGGQGWDASTAYLQELRASNSGVLSILSTDATRKPRFEGQGVEVLAKPYSYQDLAAALDRLLRRKVAHKA